MKKNSFISICLLFVLVWSMWSCNTCHAEGISIGNDANSAYLDINGLWDFKTFNYTVTGTCPPGNPTSGTVSFTNGANSSSVTMVFLSGMTCNPQEACIYRGGYQSEKNVVVSNNLVDSNGGLVTNSISITWTSPTSAYGTGASVYNFANGVSCTWHYDLTLTKHDASNKNGWWYDENALGSGISIEIQDGNLFMGWYTYDQVGNPIWVSAAGPVIDNSFSAILYKWHGWYLEDNYSVPTPEPVGTVQLDLSSDNTTVFNWTYNGISGNSTMVRFMDSLAPGERDPRNIHGWWYCPGMEGMGLFMEAQADIMFLTWYNYDLFGGPLWWTASETFRPDDTTFVSVLKEWHNGQCPGCEYRLPTAFDKETVVIEFQSDSTATLIWKGRLFHIKRFVF